MSEAAQAADLTIHNAAQMLTLAGGPQRGGRLGDLGLVADGALAVREGRIVGVGASDEIRRAFDARRELDAEGRVLMPGFVDPHTHLIWAGDRAREFEQRLAGVPYLEILEAGGGILSTVRETRRATLEQLVQEGRARLWRMLALGTTTAEAKTGYGLQTEAELRALEAIITLDEEGPWDLAPTLLGAHAVAPEFEGDADGYADYVKAEMLPEAERWWRQRRPEEDLPFFDVFCERGAFNLEQTRGLLEAAQERGFPLKLHADEFEALGGTELAAELAAVSVDHLVETPRAEIEALGRSGTVAVSLPCTPFGLGQDRYTPAGDLLEAGAILALATDLNPGTAWCESMQFALAVGCRELKLTPAQAIAAATINAAAAIGRADRVGSLEVGKQADVLILEVADYRHLGYRFGGNLVSRVIKRGELVADNRQ